jgi:broad specificity phosphatase PhoE
MTTERAGARLILVRHGRSSHVHRGWVDSRGIRAWREAYEAAGIRETERVPAGLEQVAAQVDLIVSSDAARALSTARLLAPERAIIVSPLLRELDLKTPDLGGLRLPLAAWTAAIAGRVLLLTLRRQYPSASEVARLSAAAAWLEELTSRHSSVLAVTHGSFRQEIARLLLRTGWEAEDRSRAIHHWSAWSFIRPQ